MALTRMRMVGIGLSVLVLLVVTLAIVASMITANEDEVLLLQEQTSEILLDHMLETLDNAMNDMEKTLRSALNRELQEKTSDRLDALAKKIEEEQQVDFCGRLFSLNRSLELLQSIEENQQENWEGYVKPIMEEKYWWMHSWGRNKFILSDREEGSDTSQDDHHYTRWMNRQEISVDSVYSGRVVSDTPTNKSAELDVQCVGDELSQLLLLIEAECKSNPMDRLPQDFHYGPEHRFGKVRPILANTGRSSCYPDNVPYILHNTYIENTTDIDYSYKQEPYEHGNPLGRSCMAMAPTSHPCQASDEEMLSGNLLWLIDSPYTIASSEDLLAGKPVFNKSIVNMAIAPGVYTLHFLRGPFNCRASILNAFDVNPVDPRFTENTPLMDFFLVDSAANRVPQWNAAKDLRDNYQNGYGKLAFLFLEADPQLEGDLAFGGLPGIDISLTYYAWADIHTNYIMDPLPYFRNKPLPFHMKRDFVFINTNCPKYRQEIMAPFFDRLHIDSFGGCMKNADICTEFPQCCSLNTMNRLYPNSAQKECIVYHYKFTFSTENHWVYNYTTEKMWQPLKMGSVPVYWGHPSVKQVVPDPGGVIFMDDFSTFDELADYLLEIKDNEEKYNEFLEWKSRPFREAFIRETESGLLPTLCRLSDDIAYKREFRGVQDMHSIKGINALTNHYYGKEDINRDLSSKNFLAVH